MIVLLLLCWSFFNNYRQIQKLQRELEQLENEISETKEKNTLLENQLEKVDDDEYIERIARERLGLVKPGETLLIPVEDE